MAGHLIGWVGLGLVFGWIYGWRRLRPSYERVVAAIDDPEFRSVADRRTRARELGRARGLRLVAAAGGALFGTVAGLMVGLLTFALATYMGWKVGP